MEVMERLEMEKLEQLYQHVLKTHDLGNQEDYVFKTKKDIEKMWLENVSKNPERKSIVLNYCLSELKKLIGHAIATAKTKKWVKKRAE